MGKNPSFPFYPSDWTRDLDDQDLEIEGAWIRICCRLWWSPEKGKATKTIKEWARILRKTEQKTIKIFQKLIEKDIASGEILDNQKATIINRRMFRQNEISELRQRVGRLGGNPKLKETENILDNQKDNQKRLSSSSSSSSSSLKKTTTGKNFVFPGWVDQKLFKDFSEMRTKIKKPITSQRAINMLVGKLESLIKKGYTQELLVETAITYCWQSFYEPKKIEPQPEQQPEGYDVNARANAEIERIRLLKEKKRNEQHDQN